MAAPGSLFRRVESLEARRPSGPRFPTFLELLGEDAKDLENSAARREPDIYETLNDEQRLDVHRREIARLEAAAPGIDGELWAKFISQERDLLEELQERIARQEAAAKQPTEGITLTRGVGERIEAFEDRLRGAGHAAKPAPDRLSGFREADGEHSIDPRYT